MPAPVRRPQLVLPPRVDDPWQDLGNMLAACPPELRQQVLARLPAEYHRVVLEAASRAEGGWRRNPATFANYLTRDAAETDPYRVKLWRYSVLLAEKYRQLVTGESPRQLWELPARYGKTLLSSVWGSVWTLDQQPWRPVILTSYADQLALENAVAVRDLATRYADHLRFKLRQDRGRANRWHTTEGGGLLAVGAGGSMTGFPGGVVVADDLFKNWMEAHSEATRRARYEWLRSVVRLRLNSEADGLLVVGTRWHEGDVQGLLRAASAEGDGDTYDVTRIPALAEPYDPNAQDPLLRVPDPLGRAPGEPIEPERFTEAEVRQRHRALGTYLAAAMEQQRPAPEEGGEFKRAWWQWAEQLPARYDQACVSVDPKLKDKRSGSYVAVQVWGRVGTSFYLRWATRGQWGIATVKAAIALCTVRYPDVQITLVENTGNGPEVMEQLRSGDTGATLADDVAGELGITTCGEAHTPAGSCCERGRVEALLRRGMTGLLPRTPKGDKVARARAHAGLVEGGHVWLPSWAADTWGGSLVAEAATFPDEPNDQVDTMSQALQYLRHGDARTHVPQGVQIQPGARGRGPAAGGQGLQLGNPLRRSRPR